MRGRVRSRKPAEVLAEITRLAQEGYKEVVLTGIHLSSYGLEKKEREAGETVSEFDLTLKEKETAETTVLPLLSLIRKVQEIPGIERIRLGSLEPRIMTEAFVKELATLPKVCPHFHLSLQSGCDATLKRMNRKYTTTEYREAVERLRRYFVLPAITTDIIVGFPGETEEEFCETLRFAEEIAFSQIHIFKYSRRAGTAADRMKEQVPEPVKTERSDRLEAVERALREQYPANFSGKAEEVLFEEELTVDGTTYLTGHTTRYVKVAVKKTEELLPNEIRAVCLTGETLRDMQLAIL